MITARITSSLVDLTQCRLARAVLPKVRRRIPAIPPHIRAFLGSRDSLKLAIAHGLQSVVPISNHGNNANIVFQKTLPKPKLLTRKLLRRSPLAEQVVNESRAALRNILEGKDSRKIIIVGPCSIHDPATALEYAKRLKALAEEPSVKKEFLIVMRCYFEKPRTVAGWKGLLSEPGLREKEYDATTGLFTARAFLSKVVELGLPTATEVLEAFTPQYIEDLISWTAIGARTVESQPHRNLASGLSTPVGMKNGTSGDIQVALDAIQAAQHASSFSGIDEVTGRATEIHTRGNPHCHLVLRGGKDGVNYDGVSIDRIREMTSYKKLSLAQKQLVVDCSHANSEKRHQLQSRVFENVIEQIVDGVPIAALMLESYLNEGNVKVVPGEVGPEGVSITDACIGFAETERLIRNGARKLAEARTRVAVAA